MVFRSKIHWKSVLPCFQNKVCQKCETNFLEQIQIENSSIKNVTNFSSPILVSPIFFSQTDNHQSVECSLISLFVQYYYSNLRITVISMTHNWWVIAVFYLYIDHCHEHVSWTVAIHNILHQKCFFFLFSQMANFRRYS